MSTLCMEGILVGSALRFSHALIYWFILHLYALKNFGSKTGWRFFADTVLELYGDASFVYTGDRTAPVKEFPAMQLTAYFIYCCLFWPVVKF